MLRTPTRRIVVQHIVLGGALAALATFIEPPALALPKERDLAVSARVEDADGRALDLATLKGKPYVVIYDDKTSAPKSEAFRLDLVKQLRASGVLSKVKVLFVADVSPYNFWPARGIVLDAVRDASKKAGTTVYCDWTAGVRSAYRLKDEVTSIVFVGKDARVALTHEGIPTGAAKQRLIDALTNAANSS